MSDELRYSPSGPSEDLSDMMSPPGTLLGRPLTAVGLGFAEPLDGAEVGANLRFSGYASVALSAGNQDNVPFPDGVRTLDVLPTGAVVLQGIAIDSARGNTGSLIVLRRRGTIASGALQIASAQSSITNNRFFTPAATLFDMNSEFDALMCARYSQRWQPTKKLLVPSALSPGGDGALVLPFSIRTAIANTGAPASDTTITAGLPFNTRIIDLLFQVSTAVGASTAEVRTAAGGGGLLVSSVLSTATTGTRRNNAADTASLLAGTPLFLRRSTGATAGSLIIFCQPIP